MTLLKNKLNKININNNSKTLINFNITITNNKILTNKQKFDTMFKIELLKNLKNIDLQQLV